MTSMIIWPFLVLASAPAVETKTLVIDGAQRTADVFSPTVRTKNPPLVFGFHGHGGNSRNAARSFQIHRHWPEAVVVYPQGLPTVSAKVDPEGKRPGWQNNAGQYGDRDLKFFDGLLKLLKDEYGFDPDRVFALGHSNGGRFTYLLMQQRGEVFAAFAPSGSPAHLVGMPQKPVFHIAGAKDPLVKFEGQSRALEVIKRKNGCSDVGKSLSEHATLYPSKNGNDVVAYFHPGGHEYPTLTVPSMIVEFFKSHPRK